MWGGSGPQDPHKALMGPRPPKKTENQVMTNPVRYRLLAYILRLAPSVSTPFYLQGVRWEMLAVPIARKNIEQNCREHRAPAEHLQ